jgi:hypothetical protein
MSWSASVLGDAELAASGKEERKRGEADQQER